MAVVTSVTLIKKANSPLILLQSAWMDPMKDKETYQYLTVVKLDKTL